MFFGSRRGASLASASARWHGSVVLRNTRASVDTVLTGDSAVLAANPFLYTKLPYNAERDFTPVGMKRLAGASTASASALEPMRHNRLSVFRRAPEQLGHSV